MLFDRTDTAPTAGVGAAPLEARTIDANEIIFYTDSACSQGGYVFEVDPTIYGECLDQGLAAGYNSVILGPSVNSIDILANVSSVGQLAWAEADLCTSLGRAAGTSYRRLSGPLLARPSSMLTEISRRPGC